MGDMFHSDYQLTDTDIFEIKQRYEIVTNEIELHYGMQKFTIFNVTDKVKKKEWHFIISVVAFLFGKNFEKYRIQILESYGVKSVITLKKQFFNHATIPMALVILGKSNETWFTSAASMEELEKAVFSIKNYNRKVNYTKHIDTTNLMPDYYDNDVKKVNESLDKFETKKLYEVADVISGKNAKKEEFLSNGVQYLRARNLVEGHIVASDVYLSEEVIVKFSKQILQEGDILLSKNFGEHRIAMVTENDLPAVASNALFIIRATDVPEGYLYQYFTSKTGQETFKPQLDRIVKGTTITSINLSDLREIRIPIYDSQTMNEIADLQKLEYKQVYVLSKKLEHRITETQVEQMVIGQLIQAGWSTAELKYEEYSYFLKLGREKWYPDIVLLDDHSLLAVIEVKISIFNIDPKWIEKMQDIIRSSNAKLLILTTGSFYEVYVIGTNKHQRFFKAPSKNELIKLLDKEVLE